MAEQKADEQATTGASADAAASTGGQASGERTQVTLSHGRGGILGIKAGMTQIYTPEGNLVAVTVIDLKPAVVTQVKTKANDGYDAIQVGFIEKKAKAANKPEQGHAKKVGAAGFYHYQEFRLPEGKTADGITAGNLLSAEFVKEGDLVDLSARSKGKGYQGGMKRFHMHGSFKTHGASVNHRSLGSIGNRADPSKVFKNRKMPGQMGHVNVTVQNVRVARVDLENQLLLVHGSVPGPRSGIVTIRRAVKSVG